MGDRLGVVVMAYGTPATPDDVAAYYTHIRRGHPPTPEQLADLVRRYDAIGGTSPLAERTEAQRAALASALEERAPGRCTVVLGQKHAAPFIEDAATELLREGAAALVGLVLAPHYSGFSVGQYQERLAEAAGDVPVGRVDSWHLEPAYIEFLARAVRDGLATLPAHSHVLFTAHSLPERVLVGDPYPEQLAASAAAIAGTVGLARDRWSLAWQSAGRTAEPWRGPDVLAVLREIAAGHSGDGVLVCPHGFVSDHLEVVYDLDIEAAGVATEVGLAFARTRVLNDDPGVLSALADRVLAAAP
ncbi:MAG: ferrochelatase [Acidimicrobiales bacterium]